MINLFYDLFHRIIDEGSGAQLIADASSGGNKFIIDVIYFT